MQRKHKLALESRYAMRYIWPSFILIGAVLVFPLFFSFTASFMKWNLVPQSIKWVGLKNYSKIFSDSDTWHSIWLTLKYAAVSVAFEMLLGFIIASFLNIDFKGNKIVRVIVLMPMMLSPTIVSICWKFLLNYDRGAVNKILEFMFGPQAKQVWLGKDWAFYAVMLVDVWVNTSFVVLNVLAGLQSVPLDVLEASKIDGANSLQRTFHVTIPMIKPVLLVALIFRTTFALRNFSITYVLTGGGPANYTWFYSLELYQEAFGKYHVGYASALSWILIAVTFVFSILYTKITMKGEN